MNAKIKLVTLVLNFVKTKKIKPVFILSVLCFGLFSQQLVAQPLVYNRENTGAACLLPAFPSIGALPSIKPLPDPFLWANGSGRSTNFSDWECRRNEIRAQIENYEIGIKPPKPESVTATYTPAANPATGGTLTVFITRGGQSMTLTSAVALPTGFSGPYPAVIGMNSASGSIPASVFTSKGIARITYNHNQVTTYNSASVTNPFFRLYPEYNLTVSGQYSAWAWGVSRLIDGLELVQASLPIKLDKLGVTGCSYAGKMALFSGAFDERIALTIAQESGGGGAPAWRISHNIEPNGSVEKIDNTNYDWFKDALRTNFAADNVYKLPYDHHELMAMVAPRALLVTGNTDFTWLSNKAAYITARATKKVYETLGIGDRMGFYIDGGHGHCVVPASQIPAIQAFVDKFLAGEQGVNTDNISVNPFPDLDYERWYKWWGTGRPILPETGPSEIAATNIWLEAECANVGAQWQTKSDDAEASKGAYVVAKENVVYPNAPTDPAAATVFPFVVDKPGSYNVFARINPAATDYNLWSKVDDGTFEAPVKQLIQNPGFEQDFSNWAQGFFFTSSSRAIETAPANVHSGTKSLKVVCGNTNGTNYYVQIQTANIAVVVGKKYEVSYWIKADKAGGIMSMQTAPDYNTQADQNIDVTWKQINWTFTAPQSPLQIVFLLGKVNGITYYIDDVTMKELGGTEWVWAKLKSNVVLGAGAHTVSIANLEGAAKVDKILVTTSADLPVGKGVEGTNCPCPALGSTLYVNAAINNSSSTGASWGCAMPELSTAVAYANVHPEITAIWVAKGTYKPGNNRSSSFTINRSNLRILGGFDGSETDAAGANPVVNKTIISADIGVAGDMSDNNYHSFLIHGLPAGGTLEINGFEVRDGNANLAMGDNNRGAAAFIYDNNAGSDITFNRMTFANNAATEAGGAIYLDKTNITISESRFNGNSSKQGGAVFSSSASPSFTSVSFEDNTSMNGAAIYGSGGSAMFNKTAFAYNSATQAGGAVYQDKSDADYFNSVLVSNIANQGAGIYLHHNSNAKIVNATFYANAVTGNGANGGAIALDLAASKVDVSNSIFNANTKGGSATVTGADIVNTFYSNSNSSTFNNNILQAGTWVPADKGKKITNNQRGVNPMFTNGPIPAGGDLLWATADDGLQLKSGSPAINAGSNTSAMDAGLTEDIMGNSRMCNTVDIGAYEADCENSSSGMVSNNLVKTETVNTDFQSGIIANPFAYDLRIRYDGKEKCSASIFDVNGRVILNGRSISQGITHVDASTWNKGLYHVILTTQSGKRMVFKAIKL